MKKSIKAEKTSPNPILVGNSFPLSLIRRRVTVVPETAAALRTAARGRPVVSFWGHPNTLAAAEAFAGIALSPREPRPAIELDRAGYLRLYGHLFADCWVLAARYASGLRPAPVADVPVTAVKDWQVLHVQWPNTKPEGEETR